MAGGFGGAVGMIISTPFDVVRTRLIAQDVNKGYSGMSNALRTILAGEGMKGLFRGLVPGVAQIARGPPATCRVAGIGERNRGPSEGRGT